MTEIRTVARPYAEALYEAVKDSDLSAWLECLQNLSEATQLPDFQRIVLDPKVDQAKLLELLLSIAAMSNESRDQVKNFLRLLLDNHRLDALLEIKTLFENLVNQHNGYADAYIVSAFELDNHLLNDLLAKLELRFKSKLKPHLAVDSSLIGGVCVTVGDEVLDLSVRAQLIQMQNALTA